MNTVTLLASATLVTLLSAAPHASASTAADCQLQIATLAEETTTTPFLRGDKGVKTELQLLFHLTKASDDLDKLDVRDALKQMEGYSTDLARAVGSATIAPSDAAALQTGADAVVACVQTIP